MPKAYATDEFNLPASEELYAEESTLQLQPMDDCSPPANSCDQSSLANMNGHTSPIGEFAVFAEALCLCGNPDYQLFWPIRHGFLQQDANYSAVIQDLEDIWTAALEKHIFFLVAVIINHNYDHLVRLMAVY
ncbi:hypothetical protein EG68_11586 [Paragonimus skrjabini miyazakii]|uniref:Uncharacterized protein n=1 Tax=Paragonimus skrjabini miyazakii TaxID=59628 RepID=A0A8S9YE36_9TREM|nr:hypothetical protein EG68_11586 [Paragonimus skrjabini miyazakii]